MSGWLAAVVAGALFTHWYRRRILARRRAASELDDVVALVDELLRQVRSGASLSAGLLAAASIQRVEGIALVEHSLAAGRRLVPSLDRVADERPGTPLALAAVAVGVLVEVGVGAAAGLERLAETLRAQRAAAAERRTQAAQAGLSALVLGVLPILATVALLLGSASSRAVYAGRLGGWCVAVMVILIVLGQVWMDLAIWGRWGAMR